MTTATLSEKDFDISRHKRMLTDEINKCLNNSRAVLLIPQEDGEIHLWSISKESAEKFTDSSD